MYRRPLFQLIQHLNKIILSYPIHATTSTMVRTLPFADTQVTVPGFGAMSFSHAYGPTNDETSLKTLDDAVKVGCTFIDTASVYGYGHNEELIGKYLKANPGAREKVFIGSKCGFHFDPVTKERGGVTNSKEHIESFIDDSIARLGTTPDLYYLHRIEPGRDLQESIGTLDAIRKAGKTKYIGLSECSAATLRKACAIAKIDAIQIEYSAFFVEPETNGLIATAKEFGVAVVAFSPLGAGFLTGKYNTPEDFAPDDYRRMVPRFAKENMEANLKIVEAFKSMSAKKDCTPAQLALAWVIAQGSIPIPGTKTTSRMEENFGATNVTMEESELKAIRDIIDSVQVSGERFPDFLKSMVGH